MFLIGDYVVWRPLDAEFSVESDAADPVQIQTPYFLQISINVFII